MVPNHFVSGRLKWHSCTNNHSVICNYTFNHHYYNNCAMHELIIFYSFTKTFFRDYIVHSPAQHKHSLLPFSTMILRYSTVLVQQSAESAPALCTVLQWYTVQYSTVQSVLDSGTVQSVLDSGTVSSRD